MLSLTIAFATAFAGGLFAGGLKRNLKKNKEGRLSPEEIPGRMALFEEFIVNSHSFLQAVKEKKKLDKVFIAVNRHSATDFGYLNEDAQGYVKNIIDSAIIIHGGSPKVQQHHAKDMEKKLESLTKEVSENNIFFKKVK